MPEHVWAFAPDDPETTTRNVVWRCSREGCGARVGFNRPGIGEPCATETELPDNAAEYVGPCVGVE